MVGILIYINPGRVCHVGWIAGLQLGARDIRGDASRLKKPLSPAAIRGEVCGV